MTPLPPPAPPPRAPPNIMFFFATPRPLSRIFSPQALRSTLGEDTNTIHCEADDLEWNKSAFSRDVVAAGASRVQTRTPSDRPAGIDSCGGEASPARTGDFDLLVGADGLDSPIRRQALGETAGEAEPVRRGYVVYRGVCAAEGGAAGAGWDLESFQTWGAGKRFASVPLAGAERVSAAAFVEVSDGQWKGRCDAFGFDVPGGVVFCYEGGDAPGEYAVCVQFSTAGAVRVSWRQAAFGVPRVRALIEAQTSIGLAINAMKNVDATARRA